MRTDSLSAPKAPFVRLAMPLLALLLAATTHPLCAEHILGGHFQYEFLRYRPEVDRYDYRVVLWLYVDRASANFPGGVQPYVFVTAYDAATLQQVAVDGPRAQWRDVTPDLPASCLDLPVTRIGVTENRYEAVLQLPANEKGHYLFYERCCRSNGMANIGSPTASIFWAYVPPAPALVNRSPVSVGSSAFQVCIGETTTLLNQVADPDGDSLAYEWSAPYDMVYTTPSSVQAVPPAIMPPGDLPLAPYRDGYSASAPFGAGGQLSIDPASGLSAYFVPRPGLYLLGLRIREYRNVGGQRVLVGDTYREVQVVAQDCPVNPVPEVATGLPGGGAPPPQDRVAVYPGAKVCREIRIADDLPDSVYVTGKGPLFGGSGLFPGPYAQLSVSRSGSGLSGEMCWQTDCDVAPGIYPMTIEVSDRACPPKTVFREVVVEVLPLPVPQVAAPAKVCAGGEALLRVLPPYIGGAAWYSDSTMLHRIGQGDELLLAGLGRDTTVYAALSVQGCRGRPTAVRVPVARVPQVSVPAAACAGDPVEAVAVGGVDSIHWFKGGDPMPVANGAQLPEVPPGTYHAVAFAGGCWSRSGEITVHPVPPPPVIALADTLCFAGEEATLRAMGSGLGQIRWYHDAEGARAWATGEGLSWSPTATTTVWAREETPFCRGAMSRATVVVRGLSARFEASKLSGIAPVEVSFANLSRAAGSYQWDFGDGTFSGEASPTHVFARPGRYVVRLTALAGQGCVAEYTAEVVAAKDLIVPNVITPNGDGQNDRWVLGNLDAFGAHTVTVTNQWGGVVMRSGQYGNDWEGGGLPPGTYFYVIELPEEGIRRQGTLLIAR